MSLRAAGRAARDRAASRPDLRPGHDRRRSSPTSASPRSIWGTAMRKEVVLSTLEPAHRLWRQAGAAGRRPRRARGRDRRRDRPQRRRQVDADEDADRPAADRRAARSSSRARMSAHWPRIARARLGIGYVPQGRDVFPRMTVEENLRVGEIDRRQAGTRPTTSASMALSRSSPSGAASAPAPCRAASSSSSAIGRVLVGRPVADPARRAVRGHPAVDRPGHRPHHHRSQPADRRHDRLRRAEPRHDPRHGAALLRHGQGAHRRGADAPLDLQDRDLVRRHLAV